MVLHIGGPSGLASAGDLNAAIAAEKARADTAYLSVGSAVSAVTGAAAVASKNLYNPNDVGVAVGYLLSAGTPAANSTYTTSGYIPVVAGQSYTLSNPRSIAYYDGAKAFLSQPTLSGSTTQTVVPAATGFIRASFVTALYAATFQVEQNASQTSFAQYGYTEPNLLLNAPCVLTRAGTTLSLATKLGSSALVQNFTTDRTPNYNDGFNINETDLDGVLIHVSASGTPGDDVTPIRTQMGTVGGNHGFSNVVAFLNPDGKTTADLGSVWTDGSREYVLLGFEPTGELQIGGSYTTTSGVTSSATVAAAASLTHVSGATHTGTISRTGSFNTQMYPSSQRMTVHVHVDGERVRTDGIYRGERVVVRESYEVLDYADLYDKAKANIGVSYTTLAVRGAVRVTNSFTYTGNGRCRLSWTVTAMLPTILGNCGLVQSVALSQAGATTWRHIPGLTAISGFDFANGIDLTSYNTSLLATTSNLRTTGVPPIFSLDRLVVSGATTVGFAQGYLPYAAGVASNAQRIANTPTRLWDMRNTKKSYANAITSLTMAAGDRITGEAFRTYLSPTEVAAAIASPDALTAWAALDAIKGLTSASSA